MSDEPDKGTWIAAIERALKVAVGNGAKAHPRVAAIKKPAGCDPCSYPECGCAYSQDDDRRAGRRPVAVLATTPHNVAPNASAPVVANGNRGLMP